MTREEMLIEMLAQADKEIHNLKERAEFLEKEAKAQFELTKHLADQVFNNFPKMM